MGTVVWLESRRKQRRDLCADFTICRREHPIVSAMERSVGPTIFAITSNLTPSIDAAPITFGHEDMWDLTNRLL